MWKNKCSKCENTIWFSKEDPSVMKLAGIKVRQKGRSFYVVAAKARDLDCLCKVPQIDSGQSNDVLAKMALDLKTEEWQRMLDAARIEDISRFFQGSLNFFVNSIIVSLPNEYSEFRSVPTSLSGVDLVYKEIKPTWMIQECPVCHAWVGEGKGEVKIRYWFDRCPNHECAEHFKDKRPGVIIDGQHRIRGTQGKHCTGSNPEEPLLAAILTENEFDKSKQAKVFTEITTSAVDLEPLHKIYLLNKFRMEGPTILALKADFREDSELGRRNRRAYEIACRLCSTSSAGKWFDRISILRLPGGRLRRADYIEIAGFVPVVAEWLKPNGVFSDNVQPDGMKSAQDACSELDDYLRSIVETWPGDEHWTDDRKQPGCLQDRGIFYVLFNLFAAIAQRIDARGAQRSLTEFKKEFNYLSGIKWKPNWTRLNAPGRNRSLLLKILRYKMDNASPADDPSYGPDPDLNTYIENEPAKFDWKTPTKKLSKTSLSKTNYPLTFKWDQPINAYTNAYFQIKQGTDLLFRDSTIATSVTLDQSPPALKTGPRSPDIEITVSYTNHTGKFRQTDMIMTP